MEVCPRHSGLEEVIAAVRAEVRDLSAFIRGKDNNGPNGWIHRREFEELREELRAFAQSIRERENDSPTGWVCRRELDDIRRQVGNMSDRVNATQSQLNDLQVERRVEKAQLSAWTYVAIAFVSAIGPALVAAVKTFLAQ